MPATAFSAAFENRDTARFYSLYVSGDKRGFARAFSRCDSPIEQAYCLTIFAQLHGARGFDGIFEQHLLGQLEHGVWVFPQQPIGAYRVDFLLVGIAPVSAEPRFVVVECDGKAYHSTPEQLASDERRQKAIENTGFTVVRFTGSDLWTDPGFILRKTVASLIYWSLKPADNPQHLLGAMRAIIGGTTPRGE